MLGCIEIFGLPENKGSLVGVLFEGNTAHNGGFYNFRSTLLLDLEKLRDDFASFGGQYPCISL